MELRHYLTRSGKDPFQEWFDSLADLTARVAILRRVDRLSFGNVGDSRFLREGISELRIDHGPGYRIYFARSGASIILLLGGGSKRTQKRDIEAAVNRWRDFKGRQQ
jgi:putative addiction module killer protein